jgi:hypothetical protein
VTKVNSEFKENSMVEYNLYLMRINNGQIKNFMQPIGLGKEQKRKSERIKNLMIKYYDKSVLNKSNETNLIINVNSVENDSINVILYSSLNIKINRK